MLLHFSPSDYAVSVKQAWTIIIVWTPCNQWRWCVLNLSVITRCAVCSLSVCSYQFAVILLIYLLPLLVMLVTYSLVGQTLWGGRIPGEATDHYHSQITAKRKVSVLFLLLHRQKQHVSGVTFCDFLMWFLRWWRWWLSWWWPLPSVGCPTTSTSYWGHLTEKFINNITFNRWAAASLLGLYCCLLNLMFNYHFASLSGVSGHILVGNEFNHVQSDYLLLSKPKVKDIYI